MTLQIEIPKKNEGIVLAILRLFGAKVISRSQEDKSPLYNQINEAINELKEIKEGKIRSVPAKEYLRGLQD